MYFSLHFGPITPKKFRLLRRASRTFILYHPHTGTSLLPDRRSPKRPPPLPEGKRPLTALLPLERACIQHAPTKRRCTGVASSVSVSPEPYSPSTLPSPTSVLPPYPALSLISQAMIQYIHLSLHPSCTQVNLLRPCTYTHDFTTYFRMQVSGDLYGIQYSTISNT